MIFLAFGPLASCTPSSPSCSSPHIRKPRLSGSAATYTDRAMARYALGDLEGAISDLDIAIAIAFDPGYAAALYNRGRAQHDKRNLDHAIEDYSRAIAIDPRLAQAYNTLSANCLSSPLVGASMPKSACTRVKIVFT